MNMDKITYKELLERLKNLPEETLEQEALLWDMDKGKCFQINGFTSAFDVRYASSGYDTLYLKFHGWYGWD